MSIQAILSAVDSGFSSTMKSAEQAVSGLSDVSNQATKQNKGFMSSVKTVATGIGVYKLASAGLNAVSSGFGEVVGEMTDSNIAWQTFDGNMQMLGQTPKQIAKVQKSLQDFATASIYGASDMATTYAQMAALGVDNTEQLVKGMGGLASSAENPQQAMKTLSQQMVQALAKPEMQWQDFKLMMESAPSAMAQVAKHMGMSLDELILGIQDGEIASKDFAQAVAEVGTNEQFSKLATTFKSTGQALDGMTETLANKLMPAFKALDKIGIKAVEGLSDMIDKVDVEGLMKKFTQLGKIVAPAFKEIGRVAGKAFQAVGQFFQPVGTMFEEIGASISVFSNLLLTTIGRIGRGDWAGAWESLTSNISGRFRSLSASFRTMVADMWSNLKELGANVGNFINNIDWGSVYDSIDGFFGTIGEQIMAVDWKLVGGEIGGSINELVGGVKSWLDANVPKVIEYAQTVLFNPQSELNIEAGAFHAEVMGLIDGFVEGLGIEEFIHDFVVEMNAKPMFSWGSWEDEISSALAKMRRDILTVVQGIQNFGNELDQVQVNQEVVMDIMLRRGEGWDESQIKAWIDETYGEGTYDTIIELVPTIEVTEPPVSYSDSIQAWADANATDLTIEQQVAVAIDAHIAEGGTVGDLQHLIDQQFGEGTYQSTVKAELMIEILRSHGVDEGQIQSYINGQFGHNTYELIAQVEAIAEIVSIAGADESELKRLIDEQFGEGAYDHIVKVNAEAEVLLGEGFSTETIRQMINEKYGDKAYDIVTKINPKFTLQTGHSGGASMAGQVGLSGQIESLVQSMVPKAPIAMSIPVAPQLTTGGAGATGEGGSGFDLSGITAQITAELESLKATVSAAMDGINSTIMTQASAWGTSIASAMTTMVTSVTATMTAMTMAVTLAMTAMTMAVSMAMTSLSQTVTTTMTSMAETVATTMTSMAESVTQAMTAMADAITQAMTALVEAVSAGMNEAVSVVEAGASSIVEAVSGLYDSMYSAGQSAGQGLTDGLNSMQGAVSAAAAALASAANVAARAAFVINSPSKVWRGFGYSAGEGLVDGFDGSQRSVKKSATRLAVAGLPNIAPFSGRSSHVSVSGNVSNAQQNAELKSELSQIKKAIKEGQVIMLDGNTWVGATVDRMDTALGNNQSLGGRHQLS